ncbi:hypothetical protein CFP56_042404 [Quercus suber]|uniref:Uncharacterized protein n=1 Tax=Quercus suber TaxID=58331 RepID=A0AAW0ITB3_QUESU
MLEACMAESLLMAGVTVTSGEYCAASAIAKILYDPNYASTYSKNENENKESSILEYLTGVLGGQLHQLWKLSPALAAAAIPS